MFGGESTFSRDKMVCTIPDGQLTMEIIRWQLSKVIIKNDSNHSGASQQSMLLLFFVVVVTNRIICSSDCFHKPNVFFYHLNLKFASQHSFIEWRMELWLCRASLNGNVFHSSHMHTSHSPLKLFINAHDAIFPYRWKMFLYFLNS